MRDVFREVHATIYGFAELPDLDRMLISAAVDARSNAQAPYSRYRVGAAALFENGKIFTGVNVEVASWTQTAHAEQTAIVKAVSECGPLRLEAMAVVGGPAGTLLTLPPVIVPEQRINGISDLCPSCGHCLQIMWEQCDGNPGIRLLQLHQGGEVAVTTIGDALTMAFGPKDLGVDVFAKS